MSETTTGQSTLAEAARELCVLTGDGSYYPNDFDGWDVIHGNENSRQRIIRLCPCDGDHDAGVQVFVFDRNMVLLGQAQVNVVGLSACFIADLAMALKRELTR